MRRHALAFLALCALAACAGEGASKLDDEQVAKNLRMSAEPARPPAERPTGRFDSRVEGFEAAPLAGPAQFCVEGGGFSVALLDGGHGAGYLLERPQGGVPAPGTYPVAASALQNPGAFRGTVSLVPAGQQEADFFAVTGGELTLASVDAGRAEGTFRIEVRSKELDELATGAAPADTVPATRATITGSFQAVERCSTDL